MLEVGVRPEQILYLTTSPRKLRATQLLFARILGTRAYISPMFRTIGQLAREICNWASESRFFPDELKPILIQRILKQRNRTVTLGFARVIGDFIADVKKHVPQEKQHQIGEILNRMLAGYEKPLERAQEALATMQEYNDQLKKYGWIDQEDVIREATVRMDDFPELPEVLILDCFVAPNQLEQQFLSQLINGRRMTIASAYWSDRSANEAYTLAARFLNFIYQQGGFVTEQPPEPSCPLELPPVYRFPNPEQEIIGICREICTGSSNLNLGETYVVFPRLSVYASLIERIFPQYYIPFTVFPRSSLSSSPLILAVLELLQMLNSDYERISTVAAFSSPYFPGLLRLPEDKELTARNRAATFLNIISRRAGIIKGKDNWRNIAKRMDYSEDNPEYEDRDFLLDLQNRIRQAIGLTEKILKSEGTARNQAQSLKQFLETVGFGSNLHPDDEWFEQLNSDKKNLYNILDTLADFEAEFGEQQLSRAEFIKTITYLLANGTRVYEKERGGVMVVEMDETLGINPQTLFFAGITENELPGAYHPDPILPDFVRRELGMPDIEFHRDWQKFHFWRVLYSSPHPPFLSFAESRDGNPVLITPFLEQEPVKYQPKPIICSEVEEQLYRGSINNLPLEEEAILVDFSQDEEVRHELNRRFGSEHTFQVTVLENYRYCPYQFYIKNVLGLETPEEPMFELDACSWGQIAHKVLARLYSQGPIDLNELPNKAQDIATSVLKEMDLPSFWREVTQRVLDNLFSKLVEVERNIRETGFLPSQTETQISGKINDIRLKGRIDRIDRRGNWIRVIDYKTGSISVSARDVIDNKTHLQLPTYCNLIRGSQAFSNSSIENMGIYSLKNLRLQLLSDAKHTVQELIDAATENLQEIVNLIRAGNFKPLEDKGSCRFCELRFTCGVNFVNSDD